MDLSYKRFHDLEELIKNSFHKWIWEGKVQTQLFNQNIEKVSGPLLANVIRKEDEIIDKLKPPLNTGIVHPSDINIDLPPEYGDIYKAFEPLAVDFSISSILYPKIKPRSIVMNYGGHTFTGININDKAFIFYTADGKDTIQYASDASKSFPFTKGLKVILELKGLYKNALETTTKTDENNYLEIMNLAGVESSDNNYVAELMNGGRGRGRKKGMGIQGRDFDSNDNNDTNVETDVVSTNPLELFTELRKLLAAKVSGHNNVYNSVVSIRS